MNEDTCPVTIYPTERWVGAAHRCGRPVKGTRQDGTEVCGVHLRTSQKAQEKNDKEKAYQKRLNAVSDALGVPVWGWDPSETPHVTLASLEELARRMADKPD